MSDTSGSHTLRTVTVLGLLGTAAAAVVAQLPEIRRYLKIERM